jgi:protocatechuate 3,4-dioxygenase beta subunit
MNDELEDDELEDHDRGLSHDLPVLINRRMALGLFGGAGLAAALAACSSGGTTSAATAGSSTSAATTTSTGGGATATAVDRAGGGPEIPEETSGPYPADGSNGVDVLGISGIVRSDIRSSFADASGAAAGVPLTFTLTVVDISSSDATGSAVKGAAVYAWHCDRDGNYSMYSGAAKGQNYLRGVQPTDANGAVTFTSIFPAAYSGRWPHIHFEIYPSLADATTATNRIRTSQLALPKAACDLVYASSGYSASVRNLAQTSLDRDMIFSDGYSLQLAQVTGTVADGMTATLRVPI